MMCPSDSFRVSVMTGLSRVTRTVESLRVIGMQARSSQMKFYIFPVYFFCYEVVPNMLQNGAR